MADAFVIISGLPGSGKTTLARPLSKALHLTLLDKDDILVSLFDTVGVANPDDRATLSRASDAILETIAGSSGGAVLSSFWRREALSTTSGTPTEWIKHLPDARVVEVACECPPEIAADRSSGGYGTQVILTTASHDPNCSRSSSGWLPKARLA